MKTEQQQKDEAYKAYHAIRDPAYKAYLAKCKEIDEQDDIIILVGKRYKLIKE